jgi:uncharacterized protein (DUF2147 family)
MKYFSLSFALLSLASAANAAPIEGRWQNPKDSVIIDVAPCGGGTLCGKVSWASAKAKADARKGGTTSLVGTQLLSGLTPDGAGGWKGRAYLPKRNMHASASIKTAGATTLIVKGCAVAGLICKEQRWKRVN